MFKEERRRGRDAREGFAMIPAAEIRPSPDQPRKYFAEEALRSLSESIGRHGLLQPLVVRRAGGGYELIAGERRLRAARLAGMDKLPCVVRSAGDSAAAAMALVENLQRSGLTFFEEAEGIRRLVEELGCSREETARLLSISLPALSNKLRLLRLSPELRHIILRDGLCERQARALLRLEEERRPEAARRMTAGGLSVAQSDALVDSMLAPPPPPPPPAPRGATKLIMKDLRLFLNTVDHALEGLRAAGARAEYQVEQLDDGVDVRIRVQKG